MSTRRRGCEASVGGKIQRRPSPGISGLSRSHTLATCKGARLRSGIRLDPCRLPRKRSRKRLTEEVCCPARQCGTEPLCGKTNSISVKNWNLKLSSLLTTWKANPLQIAKGKEQTLRTSRERRHYLQRKRRPSHQLWGNNENTNS